MYDPLASTLASIHFVVDLLTLPTFFFLFLQRKSVVDKIKEVAHDVNMKAGEGVDEVFEKAEKGANEANAVKDTFHKKGIKESTEHVGHDANIAAGQGLAKGIEIVETAVKKTKQAIGLGKKKAEEVGGDVSKEASHISEKAEGKAEEIAGKARQTASDVKKKL